MRIFIWYREWNFSPRCQTTNITLHYANTEAPAPGEHWAVVMWSAEYKQSSQSQIDDGIAEKKSLLSISSFRISFDQRSQTIFFMVCCSYYQYSEYSHRSLRWFITEVNKKIKNICFCSLSQSRGAMIAVCISPGLYLSPIILMDDHCKRDWR